MKALDILKLCQAVDDLNTRPIIADIREAILELEALQFPKTCEMCSKKLFCEMAQKSKDFFGTKLNEQWFICYEPKDSE